jgi:hypothetical protein
MQLRWPYFSFLAFLPSILFAQVALTLDVVPLAGDNISYIQSNGINLTMSAPGEDQSWDFSQINGPEQNNRFFTASSGTAAASYPTATLRATGLIPGAETYYRVTNNQFSQVGLSGGAPGGINIQANTRFLSPLIELNLPFEYKDQKTSVADQVLAFPSSLLPSAILDSLPIKPDSIRFRIKTTRRDEADAWGMLKNGATEIPVLRIDRTDYRDTKMEMYLKLGPFGLWQDVTALLPLPFLGADTARTFLFWSPKQRGIVADATVDPNDMTIQTLRVVAAAPVVSTGWLPEDYSRAKISAMPNPAFEKVDFTIEVPVAGQYQVALYNIIGKEVFRKKYALKAGVPQVITLMVDGYSKGMYLYALQNQVGKTLAAHKLLIIRP